MSPNELGVFAKYWQPGAVKTRLASAIGDASAAAVYRSGLQLLVHRCQHLAAQRALVYWPPEREREFRRLAAAQWQVEPQVGGDLGTRIRGYFRAAFARGAEHVVLIGSDSPTLPTAYVEMALAELRRSCVVLGPSHDGGYYLVGGRREMPPLFHDIPWSTPDVYRRTCECLSRHGTTWFELPAWYDVDDLDSLRRLAAELEQRAAEDSPDWRGLAAAVRKALFAGGS